MSKRKKKTTPHMLLWSRAEQRRFVDAVEKAVAHTVDLAVVVDELKRHVAAIHANRTRKDKAAAAAAAHNGAAAGEDILNARQP